MNRTPNTRQTVSTTALEAYEKEQIEIEALLAEIKSGLVDHDRKASASPNGHNWAQVADLMDIAKSLSDLNDRLHGTGEYADTPTIKTYRAYNAQGKAVKVTVPER